MKNLIMTGLILFLVYAMGESVAQNMLTAKEKKGGWILLFDGKTTNGWRNYNSDTIGSAWKVADGSLYLDTSTGKKGGDIITEKEFQDFELKLEWKISPCGNSGLMYNVVEDRKYASVWHTGPEMQILDNTCHPDAKIEKHRAGDLYDLIASSKETAKPVGEWNEVKIITRNGNYEFWLNGTKVVSFTMHDQQWDDRVSGSKFKNLPDFGKSKKGHLSLQDHGDMVWFRNIKIKTLK